MRRALYCLTSSMTTTWHHPEVQLHYFTGALLNFHVIHNPPVWSEQLISFIWQLNLSFDNVITVLPMTTVERCRRSHQFGSVEFINKIDFWISQNRSIKLRVLFENFLNFFLLLMSVWWHDIWSYFPKPQWNFECQKWLKELIKNFIWSNYTRCCLFLCVQSDGQPSALLHWSVQTVMRDKKASSVPEPARIWICPVSASPAFPAASVHQAQ